MIKKTQTTNDCYDVADEILKLLLKQKCTLNEGITACCYAIASIMVTAEQDARNNSDGVAKECADAIQKTYEILKKDVAMKKLN